MTKIPSKQIQRSTAAALMGVSLFLSASARSCARYCRRNTQLAHLGLILAII